MESFGWKMSKKFNVSRISRQRFIKKALELTDMLPQHLLRRIQDEENENITVSVNML